MRTMKEMFFKDETVIDSNEELEIFAKRYPVLVEVKRWVGEDGEFKRTINVYTKVWAKYPNYKCGSCRSYVSNNLIKIHGRKESTISCSFETLEDAERWVSEKIIEIRNNRKMIIENIQKEKPSEYVILDD